MANTLQERDVIGDDVESLCCNFASWEDGSFTCDMMIGNEVVLREEDSGEEEFSATYTFNFNTKDGSMGGKDEDKDKEYSIFEF